MIYDHHKRNIILVFIIVFVGCLLIQYLFLSEKTINKEFIEFVKNFSTNIITFISIAFGFYLTSLSVLFSSKYIKILNIEDKIKPIQRQIHTVKAYFQSAVYWALITIFISFLTLISLFLNEKNTLIIMLSCLMATFIENFVFIYLLLKIFMNALVIQARKDE